MTPPPVVQLGVAERMGIPVSDLRWASCIYMPVSPDAWAYQAWCAEQKRQLRPDILNRHMR